MSAVWYQRPDGRWLVRCRKRKEAYLWSRVVIWDALGRELSPSEVVHHRNGDNTDDRIGNLRVLTQAEHARLHGCQAERVAILDAARPKAHAVRAERVAEITHCRHGHPYSGDNVRREANGKRVCLTCARDRNRAWRRRLIEEAQA